jgi:hypothetical protein
MAAPIFSTEPPPNTHSIGARLSQPQQRPTATKPLKTRAPRFLGASCTASKGSEIGNSSERGVYAASSAQASRKRFLQCLASSNDEAA